MKNYVNSQDFSHGSFVSHLQNTRFIMLRTFIRETRVSTISVESS